MKSLAIAFLVIILMMPAFIELKAVEAETYSLRIEGVDPGDGTYLSLANYPHLPYFNTTVIVKYNLPAASEYAGSFELRLKVYQWEPWDGKWQDFDVERLIIPQKDWQKGEISLNTTFVLDKIQLEARLYGFYTPLNTPEDEKLINLTDTTTLTYTSNPLLAASFKIEPETPAVSDTITFTSTSTTAGGTHPIAKFFWYLDGKDVAYINENIGGLEKWATHMSPSWNWSKPTAGIHTVNLTIIDNRNTTATTSKTFEVKTTQELSITSSAGGIVADGVSSVQIGVKLPTTQTKPVTLSDGTTELRQDAVNGTAIFTYIPDMAKLNLIPSQIPKEGASISLTASIDDTTSATITVKVYKRPILLVHGLWSNGATWNKMVNWLENDGFTVYTMDYPNVISLKEAAREYLAPKIEAIETDYSQPLYYHSLFKTNYLTRNVTKIDVIAHSAGGLVTRYYINNFLTNDLKAGGEGHGIKTLITVGTPHLGSPWPKEYAYWVRQQSFLPAIQSILDIVQHFLPEGTMGKEGQALDDLTPGSLFLNEVNDPQWHNPTVDYYTICGKDSWLSDGFGLALYERGFIDSMTCEKLLMTGDGVVELASQRFAERIQKGYYVDEWHCAEPCSYPVFEVASKILKGSEQQIPSIYRSPVNATVTAGWLSCSQDDEGERFQLIIQEPTANEPSTIPAYSFDVKTGTSIIASFNRSQSWLDGKDWAMFKILSHNSHGTIIGEINIRVQSFSKQMGMGIWGGIRVLSPSAFQLFYESEANIHINSTGSLTLLTKKGSATSPDPELDITIDEYGNLNMVVLEGNIVVFDKYGNATLINEGQAATINPDRVIETSNVNLDNIDRWWAQTENKEDQITSNLTDQYTILAVASILIIFVIIIDLTRKKEKPPRQHHLFRPLPHHPENPFLGTLHKELTLTAHANNSLNGCRKKFFIVCVLN